MLVKIEHGIIFLLLRIHIKPDSFVFKLKVMNKKPYKTLSHLFCVLLGLIINSSILEWQDHTEQTPQTFPKEKLIKLAYAVLYDFTNTLNPTEDSTF